MNPIAAKTMNMNAAMNRSVTETSATNPQYQTSRRHMRAFGQSPFAIAVCVVCSLPLALCTRETLATQESLGGPQEQVPMAEGLEKSGDNSQFT